MSPYQFGDGAFAGVRIAWGGVLGDDELAVGDGLLVCVRLEELLLHVDQVAVDSEGGQDGHTIEPVVGCLESNRYNNCFKSVLPNKGSGKPF